MPPLQRESQAAGSRLERQFDPTFATRLALREKQIQQNYRPIIGIHKWFARRPGTVFRSLLLAEYNGAEPLETSYWREHKLIGVIADPFMGGGTPIYEANRLGFSVLGADTNPMAFWVVRQALGHLNTQEFASAAEEVASAIENIVGEFYKTTCLRPVRPVHLDDSTASTGKIPCQSGSVGARTFDTEGNDLPQPRRSAVHCYCFRR